MSWRRRLVSDLPRPVSAFLGRTDDWLAPFEILTSVEPAMSRWLGYRRERAKLEEELVHRFMDPLREVGSGQLGELERPSASQRSLKAPKRRAALVAICVTGISGTGYAAIRVLGSGAVTLQPSARVSVPKRSNAAHDRPECLHLEGMKVRKATELLTSNGFRVAFWNERGRVNRVRRLISAPPDEWIVVQVWGIPQASRLVTVDVQMPLGPSARVPSTPDC